MERNLREIERTICVCVEEYRGCSCSEEFEEGEGGEERLPGEVTNG